MSTQSRQERLKRADLTGRQRELVERGCAYAADVWLYEIGGERVVLKDFREKILLWRNMVGKVLTVREAHVLEALEGMEGVPQYRGRPDHYSVAMTFVEGKSAFFTYPDLDTETKEAFIAELEKIAAEMHGRGVVHLDLRHRSNLLITEQGRPVIMDFASGFCLNRRDFLGRMALKVLAGIDRMAVLKWKRRLCPHLLSEADKRRLRRTRLLADMLLPRRILSALLHTVSREDEKAKK